MKSSITRPVTALLMAQGAGALAQDAAAPAPESANTNAPVSSTNAPTQLPDVTVRGEYESYKPAGIASPKYTEPLVDVPQTVTVIPQQVIQDQAATSLRDVLRNTPGISMQAGEGGGGLPGDTLSIRGFPARGDIFIDNVRDFGAYSRDPFNLEQVEVVKGPSSATTGRGSAGGSINLVSKTPGLREFYRGSLGFGTDEHKRVTVDLNQPLGAVDWESSAFRLNAMWHDAETPGRDVVEETRWGVAPSFTYGLGTPTRVTLSYFHMTQDNIPDYGIPWVPANTNAVLQRYSNDAPPVDFDNFYGLKGYDFEDIQTDVVTAALEHDFNEAVSLRNLFRYGRNHRNSAITAPRFVDVNVDTTIRRQLQRREMENEIFANQTDFRIDAETGPVEHTIVTGLELSRENQENRNSAQATNQPQTDLFNPNPNDQPLGPMPPITGTPSDARADTVALYAFDTMRFGEKWELSGGLRWDHVEADFSTPTDDLGRTDDLLSWRAGLVFKPVSYGSIYFGFGSSFNPAIEGNTGFVLSEGGTSQNNVDLEPEETRAFELGTKWELFDSRLLLGAALFRTEKVNARTLNITGDTLVLDGEQIVQGVELQAQGNITPNWSLLAGYVYQESEIEKSGNAAEVGAEFGNTPDHSFSLWSTHRFGPIEFGAGAYFTGERFNNNTGNANVRSADSFWVADAMLRYNINDNVSLQLNVYNLADERYIDRVGGGHFVPGDGRSAVLTASFSF